VIDQDWNGREREGRRGKEGIAGRGKDEEWRGKRLEHIRQQLILL
jgi:hypothetical protein